MKVNPQSPRDIKNETACVCVHLRVVNMQSCYSPAHLLPCPWKLKRSLIGRCLSARQWSSLIGCWFSVSVLPSLIPADRYLLAEHPSSPQTPCREVDIVTLSHTHSSVYSGFYFSYFSFFFSRVWASSRWVWIFSTRSSASLDELSSFFSSRLRRTFASLSSSP